MAETDREPDSRLLPWLTAIEKMGKQKSYKPILLLSIINEIEQGIIDTNKITLAGSIEQTFNDFYRRINNEQGISKSHLPFYYLQTDVWDIHWHVSASQKCPSSVTGTQKQIDHVSFRSGYFEPLMNPSDRNLIKERLLLKAEEDIKTLDPRKNPEFHPPDNISSILEQTFGKPIADRQSEYLPRVMNPLEVEFQQEKLLQTFLVDHWKEIEEFTRRNLMIYGGPATGVEYHAGSAGRIDILAQNPITKDLTVIELKKGVAKDYHLSQILRYMGWIRSKLVTNNEVLGLLIASSFQDKMKFVLQELKRVSLLEYKLSFQLETVKFS